MSLAIIESLGQSLQRLEEVLQLPYSIVVRDAAVQRFEFTIELAWKSVQRTLRIEQIVCQSPKQCLQQAFTQGWVEDQPQWLEMLEDRNLTVHTYHEETAQAVFQRLPGYLALLKNLYGHLEKK